MLEVGLVHPSGTRAGGGFVAGARRPGPPTRSSAPAGALARFGRFSDASSAARFGFALKSLSNAEKDKRPARHAPRRRTRSSSFLQQTPSSGPGSHVFAPARLAPPPLPCGALSGWLC